jgi:acetoin utilization deacetylase AcuC-like enzyme
MRQRLFELKHARELARAKLAVYAARRGVGRSFALLRPPGHHAQRFVHGSQGFCAINNEAVMIEHLRHTYGSHLKKIAAVFYAAAADLL